MRKLIPLLLAVTMLLSLAACAGETASPEASNPVETEQTSTEPGEGTSLGDGASDIPAESGDPATGGSITVYWQEFYNNYDPSLADNRNYALWYERLWSPDWDMSREEYDWSSEYVTMEHMTGQIADSWSFDADAKTLTVTLRQDVYFQTKDGELASYDIYGGRQLLAEDVAWSYRRLLGIDGAGKVEAEQNYSSKIGMLESVEVVDDFTVAFHFNTGSEAALSEFMIAGINIAGAEWDTLTAEQKSDWRYACGTGPFEITEFAADSYMTLSKNTDYYMYDDADNQLPYLDEVTLVMITDSSNAVAQFTSGSLDILGWGNDVISVSEKAVLRAAMSEDKYVEYTYVTNPAGLFLKTSIEPFQDVNVRIALQKAVDTKTITTEYYGLEENAFELFGIWSQSTAWSSVGSWSDELKETYAYDPEAAKALLTEAGYPDGFEFTIVLFSAMDVDLYTLAAEYMSQVGVTMKIETVSTPPEMQAVGMSATDMRSIPGTVGLYNLSGGIQNYASYGNNNNGAINDPALDSLVEALSGAETMEEQLAAALAEDLYVAEMHYTLQFGPAERVNSYTSGRIGGYSGERLWKNWNVTSVLTRIWVKD